MSTKKGIGENKRLPPLTGMNNYQSGFSSFLMTDTETHPQPDYQPVEPEQHTTPAANVADAKQPASTAWVADQRRRLLMLATGYLLIYFGAFHAAVLLDQGEAIIGLWYAPAGLAFFGILAFGWMGIALDALGSLLAWLLAAIWPGSHLPASSVLIGGILHPLAYAAVILPLRRRIGRADALVKPAQTAWFLAAAALSVALAASIDLIALNALGLMDSKQMQTVALIQPMGDFIRMITVTPLLLVFLLPILDDYLRHGRWRWSYLTEVNHPVDRSVIADLLALVLIMLLLAVFVIAWGIDLGPSSPFAALLLLMPLAWITLRNGLSGAALGTMTLNGGLALLLLVVLGSLSFTLEYQFVMMTIALTGLLLGGVVESRNQARSALQTHAVRLEQRVAAQTKELQLAYQAMSLKERRLRILVNAAPVGIAELDVYGYCRYLNPVGCALTGCSKEAAQGRHIFEFVHPDDRDYLEFIWELNSSHEGINRLEFRLQRTNLWVFAHWINLLKLGQAFMGSIIIFVDNTEQRNKDEQLWNQAHFDSLTGLPNRNLFWERLMQNLARAQRDSQNVAVLWIDLDGFKAVNDKLGHAAGDELLQQVAHRLISRMRKSDTVARMGGDEFAVVLPDIAAISVAEEVAMDIAIRLAEPFRLQCGVGYISASVGLALYPLHTHDAETLVKYADLAMYASKYAGKNQVTLWQLDLQSLF